MCGDLSTFIWNVLQEWMCFKQNEVKLTEHNIYWVQTVSYEIKCTVNVKKNAAFSYLRL